MSSSRPDQYDPSLASDQAACLMRPATPEEVAASLIRYIRPLSVGSETRLRPSFLRTTPARKPRTECCCHPVAVMRATVVAPAGVRSIARMRACLVSVRVVDLNCAERERGLDLLGFRVAARVEGLDFDLDFVIGSSEVLRRHPPHHLSPAQATPGRARPRSRHLPLQVTYSNAPIKAKSQSNLSNVVAQNRHAGWGATLMSSYGMLRSL